MTRDRKQVKQMRNASVTKQPHQDTSVIRCGEIAVRQEEMPE